jgi:hypothetical protein
MPPIQLSRSERSSLRKLFDRPRQIGEIPSDHQEKFINYDLVCKRVLLLYITPLGQIELLRQRFRNIKPARPPKHTVLPPYCELPLLTSGIQDGVQ